MELNNGTTVIQNGGTGFLSSMCVTTTLLTMTECSRSIRSSTAGWYPFAYQPFCSFLLVSLKGVSPLQSAAGQWYTAKTVELKDALYPG